MFEVGIAVVVVPRAGPWQKRDFGHGRFYATHLRSDDGIQLSGVYLSEFRAAAEAAYNSAWLDRVTEACGSAPSIDWFDVPVVVDNRHDEIVT